MTQRSPSSRIRRTWSRVGSLTCLSRFAARWTSRNRRSRSRSVGRFGLPVFGVRVGGAVAVAMGRLLLVDGGSDNLACCHKQE